MSTLKQAARVYTSDKVYLKAYRKYFKYQLTHDQLREVFASRLKQRGMTPEQVSEACKHFCL